MIKPKVGILTAGGLAPCLSSSIGRLVRQYTRQVPDIEIIGYLYGYQGLLTNEKIDLCQNFPHVAEVLYNFGGSILGNSRVKLSNVKDCLKRGYIHPGENPLEVAANRLAADGITILHTIGGDDTNITAAELASYLERKNYELTVVGLPKTVDNDIYPIVQTLGAWTAAEETARFFTNIANENTTSSRHLIIHEVMGRNCGWLTAYAAKLYRDNLEMRTFYPQIKGLSKARWDIHAVYIPELIIDFKEEIKRLQRLMEVNDCVNIFLSEGAGVETIVAEMEAAGEEVLRDAFNHVRLDEINPGQWFAKRLKNELQADKVLVQKSGYFARSAAPNTQDLELILKSADQAVTFGLNGQSGVIGIDEKEGEMRCIEFGRIRGGKPFDITQPWFNEMLKEIGQYREEIYHQL
ncbi:MAG: pyrophosphate--fructose-6-phosphate 1-phosphotransferase [Candidatus Cloacimonetes bacterium]|nr:pyrophosphate--fructose-6-phosphate 1-phosphotransferase [Candidatus Cloacimonadota bacterium]